MSINATNTTTAGASTPPPVNVNDTNTTTNQTTFGDKISNAAAAASDFVSGLVNSTSSNIGGLYNSTTQSLGESFNQTSSRLANLTATVSESVQGFGSAMSYSKLSEAGTNAVESVQTSLANAANAAVTSTPVNTTTSFIASSAEKITEGVNAGATAMKTNYLPVAIIGLSAFTSYTALKGAYADFKAGNLQRMSVNLLAGTATAALAGYVAASSPAGQYASSSVSGYFSKS